eukprot:Rmarinus@m.6076
MSLKFSYDNLDSFLDANSEEPNRQTTLEDTLDNTDDFWGETAGGDDALENFLNDDKGGNYPEIGFITTDDQQMWVDDALEAAGGFGLYQRRLTWLMGAVLVICSMNISISIFAEVQAPEDCDDRHNCEYTYGEKSTVAAEFELTGDDSWMASFCTYAFLFGWMLGQLLFGSLTDAKGRHMALLTGLVVVVLGNLAALSAQAFAWYVGARFILAIGVGGCALAAWLTALEFWNPTSRARASVLLHCGYPVGGVLIVLIALLSRTNWRLMYSFVMIPSFGILVGLCCLRLAPDQTPHWLASQGQQQVAAEVIEDVGRANKRPVSGDLAGRQREGDMLRPVVMGDDDLPIVKLFTVSPKCRLVLVALSFYFFNIGFLEFGVSAHGGAVSGSDMVDNATDKDELSGETYLRVFLSSVMKCLAFLSSLLVLLVCRRQPRLAALWLGAGAGTVCLLGAVAGVRPAILEATGLTAKILTAAAIPPALLYACQLIPTAVRASGVGVIMTSLVFGLSLGPGVVIFQDAQSAMAVIGMLMLVGALTFLRLPAGCGQLPDTFGQFERMVEAERCAQEESGGSNDDDDDGASDAGDLESGGNDDGGVELVVRGSTGAHEGPDSHSSQQNNPSRTVPAVPPALASVEEDEGDTSSKKQGKQKKAKKSKEEKKKKKKEKKEKHSKHRSSGSIDSSPAETAMLLGPSHLAGSTDSPGPGSPALAPQAHTHSHTHGHTHQDGPGGSFRGSATESSVHDDEFEAL